MLKFKEGHVIISDDSQLVAHLKNQPRCRLKRLNLIHVWTHILPPDAEPRITLPSPVLGGSAPPDALTVLFLRRTAYC